MFRQLVFELYYFHWFVSLIYYFAITAYCHFRRIIDFISYLIIYIYSHDLAIIDINTSLKYEYIFQAYSIIISYRLTHTWREIIIHISFRIEILYITCPQI
jgi:hypothetical protein